VLEVCRFATRTDVALTLVAVMCAAGHGVVSALPTVLFGDVLEAFGTGNVDDIRITSIWFTVLGAIAFVLSFGQIYLIAVAAQHQGTSIRRRYLEALLAQDMAWFDKDESAASLASRANADVQVLIDGIGPKVASIVQYLFMLAMGFALGFAYGWQLTLVVLSITPLLALAAMWFAKVTASASQEGFTA